MILGRLFTALFAEGVTVVATSNVEPSRLYEGGLNRALFLPFLALLGSAWTSSARRPHRLPPGKAGGAEVWHVPADEAARARSDEAFRRLTGGTKPVPMILAVQGPRICSCPRPRRAWRGSASPSSASGRSARPTTSRSPSRFHTVVLDDVPVMDFDRRNAAKRFITLIDAFYDSGVKLVASADAEPDASISQDGREAFEFQRTASRLIEMRSHDYLVSAARPARLAWRRATRPGWSRPSRNLAVSRRPASQASPARRAPSPPSRPARPRGAGRATTAPMTSRLETRGIITAITGTATTPLITAVQNSMLMGSSGDSAISAPMSVEPAMME